MKYPSELSCRFPSLIPLNGKVPIESGWQRWCTEIRDETPHPHGDGNFGIPCGPANGVLVLDVDNEDVFSVQGLEVPETFTVKTGKGKHFYFNYPNGGKTYSNRTNPAKGFDIRGDGGQIVCPGSIHPETGVVYKVIDDRELADAPQWLADEASGDSAAAGPMLPKGASLSEDATIKALGCMKAVMGLELADLRSELYQLGTRWYDGGYSDWIDVMFALHHETGGSADGLELFMEWSRQSIGRYCGDDKALDHWQSVRGYERGGRLLTWASVRKWIKGDEAADAVVARVVDSSAVVAQFLEGLKKCSGKEEVVRLIGSVRLGANVAWEVEKPIQDRLKALVGTAPPVAVVRGWLSAGCGGGGGGELEALPEWAEGWCFLRHSSEFYNHKTGERTSKEAFNLFMRQHSQEELPSELLSKSGVLPVYWNTMYLPGAGQKFEFDGLSCVNLFRGWPAMPDKRDVNFVAIDMIIAHAKRQYPEDWRILIDFLAFCVQNPGVKITWMVVLQGVEGDGKTFWSRLMTEVMGSRNTKKVSNSTLSTIYTGWATGAAFSVIEEIKVAGQNRYEIMDRLKPYITDDEVPINPKGQNEYQAHNITNYVANSNHTDALALTSTDRRYCVLMSQYQSEEHLGTTQERKAYFGPLYRTILNDAGASARWLLMHHEISPTFDPKDPPRGTAGRKVMLEEAKSSVRLSLEEYIDTEGLEYINSREARTKLGSPYCDYRCDCSEGEIRAELRRMGFHKKTMRIMGKPAKVWVSILGNNTTEVLPF